MLDTDETTVTRNLLAEIHNDQSIASLTTLRTAILDVIDAGWQCGTGCDMKHPWQFPVEMFEGDDQPSDDDLKLRTDFIDAVATQVKVLQGELHGYDAVLLAKLCDVQANYQRGYRHGWGDAMSEMKEAGDGS